MQVIVLARVGVMYLICINQGLRRYMPQAWLIQIKYIIFLHVLQQICIHIEQA